MSTITENLETVRGRIAAVAAAAGRDPREIKLLAVSKRHATAALREAFAAGQACFGENTAQESAAKIAELTDLALDWHFIGQVQSNKTAQIARHFAWVQSVDREKIAARLNSSRPAELPALNICLQLNLDGEASKSGLPDADAVFRLADAITGMPALRLRGVMAIPPASPDSEVRRRQFQAVGEVFRNLKTRYDGIDTLSIGMTTDYEDAIQEGSTMVRIGTGIFGARG